MGMLNWNEKQLGMGSPRKRLDCPTYFRYTIPINQYLLETRCKYYRSIVKSYAHYTSNRLHARPLLRLRRWVEREVGGHVNQSTKTLGDSWMGNEDLG